MSSVSADTYRRIDNDVYNREGDLWWQKDTVLHLLKTSVNPARVGYFRRMLFEELKLRPVGKRALEVGCGGGILCEEIARMGFKATGVDPSEPSLNTARNHAKLSRLDVHYDQGSGEQLPYPDRSFDVVFCCDVLEHVRDLPKVTAEIARVLKSGGVFCYDTLNRTLISKLVAIKVWQEWKRYAFMPPNLHVWEMFIKPKEIISLLERNGFEPKGQRGTSPNLSIPKMLSALRKRVKGEWTYKDLGERFFLRESNDKSILYMGYAVKR
jgi:2-polyprenyl-6-hydroxyphenyl methylase/3-demethylubiquinone-9 3-methyltransferase